MLIHKKLSTEKAATAAFCEYHYGDNCNYFLMKDRASVWRVAVSFGSGLFRRPLVADSAIIRSLK
jgi:hypothetical protein